MQSNTCMVRSRMIKNSRLSLATECVWDHLELQKILALKQKQSKCWVWSLVGRVLADHAWNPNLVPALHKTRYSSAHLWPRIAEVRNNSRKSPSAAWKVQDQHYNMRHFQKQAKLYSQGNRPAAPLFHLDNSEENVMHPYMRLSHSMDMCYQSVLL